MTLHAFRNIISNSYHYIRVWTYTKKWWLLLIWKIRRFRIWSVQFFRNLPHSITKLLVIYSVLHKRVFTPSRDLTVWIIEAINHSSNSTMAFTQNLTSRIFCKCKCHCWVWRMINSLCYSSRKIPERCENFFVNYRINYQKLCYSLRRIWTQKLYWTSVSTVFFPTCLAKSGRKRKRKRMSNTRGTSFVLIT